MCESVIDVSTAACGTENLYSYTVSIIGYTPRSIIAGAYTMVTRNYCFYKA